MFSFARPSLEEAPAIALAVPAISLAIVDGIMRDFYLPAVRRQLNDELVLLRRPGA